jgi:molecular chaperone DnaK (HSP70)
MTARGFGIDFGTTNSIIAFHDAEVRRTTSCRDADTALPHPSIVWYKPDGAVRVGAEAKSVLTKLSGVAGNAFVQSVKVHLGRGEAFDICGSNKSAVDIAADVFRHLLEDARANYGVNATEGVVTIPLYFDGRARRDLRRAADAAGFYVKAFLHEPFAALIGHICKSRGRDELRRMTGMNLLVFDWGGGTLDITVGRIYEDQIVELGIAGLPSKAGNHFDELLAGMVRRRFLAEQGIAADEAVITPATRDRYLAETERCKIALSDAPVQRMQLAGFCEYEKRVYDLQVDVTREEFEAEIVETINEAMRRVDAALETARLTARQIDLCLLVGGTSLIPMVQERLRERFGHTMVTVKDADSLIAEGAAVADAYNMRAAFAETVAMDGQARLIVGLHDPELGRFERKAIAVAPVSDALPAPFKHERIEVKIAVDEDLVLRIDAKGATQPHDKFVSQEVVDLRYSVSLAGI